MSLLSRHKGNNKSNWTISYTTKSKTIFSEVCLFWILYIYIYFVVSMNKYICICLHNYRFVIYSIGYFVFWKFFHKANILENIFFVSLFSFFSGGKMEIADLEVKFWSIHLHVKMLKTCRTHFFASNIKRVVLYLHYLKFKTYTSIQDSWYRGFQHF